MEVKTELLDLINASASVKISPQAIKNEMEKLAKKASKTMRMDGFRPGKVPVSAVLKRYEKELGNDAEQNLLKSAVDSALKALKREARELVGEPYFESFERKDGEIAAVFVLSFKPEFNLDGYEKCIPEYSIPEADEGEIDAKKQELLRRFASTEPIGSKRALKEGDFAKFDFEGFVDGKAFDGGRAENYVLEIGSKQFIPGFEEGMVGLVPGEEKEINVSFPKDYAAAHLAGKDAVFRVKLHEIETLKIPELDETLLKKILPKEEKPSLELLEGNLREQIKNEKLFKLVNEELKAKFADALLENFDFDLPRGIVEQETDMQFGQAFSTLSEDEKKELGGDEEKYKAKRESFKDEAIKSVKLTFIIDALAKMRALDVSDQELVQAVYFEAYRYGFNPKEHLENYKKHGTLPAVKMALLEEKLFKDIFMPRPEKEAKKEA